MTLNALWNGRRKLCVPRFSKILILTLLPTSHPLQRIELQWLLPSESRLRLRDFRYLPIVLQGKKVNIVRAGNDFIAYELVPTVFVSLTIQVIPLYSTALEAQQLEVPRLNNEG